MHWTMDDLAKIGVFLAMLFAAVFFTERRRAAGKPLLDEYSFRSVWKMLGAYLLGAVTVAVAVFVWTGSAANAVSIGGMLAGVILLGSLRGFLAEYQRKRDGGKNLDK